MLDLRTLKKIKIGFPGSASGKEPACQCRRHKRPGFGPWIGKIPWRRAWQPYVINHNFTDEDTETQIRPLGQDHTADKERFQPWASVNPSHSTILLLCILQLGDTAEWDLGSRGRVRAAYNWKAVYSFTCLEGVALSAGRACSCGQEARGGPSCKDSLRLKCWALTGQDGWERWA